jgi:hypothetical protein
MSITSLLVIGSFFSGAAYAGTPDGETPAEEDVCDDYSGASYGFCVAYCEAMDCDEDPNADETACERVSERFQVKSGESDAPTCGAEEPEICLTEDDPSHYCYYVTGAWPDEVFTSYPEYTDSCACLAAGQYWGIYSTL